MTDKSLATSFRVSRESWARLELYVATLLKWQRHINLIGRSTAAEVWQRHVADSLQVLPLISPGVRVIADLGSGAGFPGLALAIAGDYAVHLYESNGKKAAFLREAARLTESRVMVHGERLESLKETPNPPDVQLVTARALAPLPQLLDYAEPFFRRGGDGTFPQGTRYRCGIDRSYQMLENQMEEARQPNRFEGVSLAG